MLEKHLLDHYVSAPGDDHDEPDDDEIDDDVGEEEEQPVLPLMVVEEPTVPLADEVHFLVDEIRQSLDEGVEDVIYNLEHPLVGKHIHVLKTIVKNIIHARAMELHGVDVPVEMVEKPVVKSAVKPLIKKHVVAPLVISPPLQKTSPDHEVAQDIPPPPVTMRKPHLMPAITAPAGATFPDLPTEDAYELSEMDKEMMKEGSHEVKLIHVPLMIDDESNEIVAWADLDELESVYRVSEPLLDHTTSALLLQLKKDIRNLDVLQSKRFLYKQMRKSAKNLKMRFDLHDYSTLKYHLVRDLAYLGPVTVLLHDPKITQIMCEGQGVPLTIIRDGKRIKTNLLFKSKDSLNVFIKHVAEKTFQNVGIEDPVVDAMYQDFRIQGTLGSNIVPSRFLMTRVQH
jgi:hypothetical protein